MKLSEARKIATEVDGRIVDVKVLDLGTMRCVKLLWEDDSASFIPVHLFKGKDEKQRFREEVLQIKELRNYLETKPL